MLLQQSSLHTLQSLQSLIEQLSDQEYAQSLAVLSGNSIGKHVRHMLEFYECLFGDLSKGCVNYDTRRRNLRLENDRQFSLDILRHLTKQIQAVTADVLLQLQVSMASDEVSVTVPTTLYRELVYNIEHCIHHLALIRVAIETSLPHVPLSAQFGVAYSTIRYQQANA